MTDTNENTEHFFDTKEDYLKFKKQWASAVNDPKAKKELIRGSYGAYQKKGWIKPVHHIIYNIVRNKPLDYGFTPITSEKKLQSNNMNPNEAFDRAYYMFKSFQKSSKNYWPYNEVMEPLGDVLPFSKIKSWKEEVKHR